MANHDDVRTICRGLAGAQESEGARFGFSVQIRGKWKGFCWTWLERTHPRRARVENPGVLAIRVPNMQAKAMLLATGSGWLFDEPHYATYPAVLVRLDEVPLDELADLLIEGYRSLVGG
jgi:hypothetical protein